jgi:hypothetical protein
MLIGSQLSAWFFRKSQPKRKVPPAGIPAWLTSVGQARLTVTIINKIKTENHLSRAGNLRLSP